MKIGTEGLGLWIEPSARDTDPQTSMAASASMRSHAHIQRLQILKFLEHCAERGATADECDLALSWRNGRAGRRLGELVKLNLGVIQGTRETQTGRSAQVYKLPIYKED